MTIYIQNTQKTSFVDTWLIIKKHKKTGLLYFCKTTFRDPEIYIGSGKYWLRHIKEHGKDVETIWLCKFTNKDDLIEFATFFSEFFNIINEKNKYGNKVWANLEIENGITGMPPGTDRGDSFREKSKINNKGAKNPSYGKFWWNNGIDEVKQSLCPPGYTRGRAPKQKKIMGEWARSGKNVGVKNPSYDNLWWTNGVDSVKSKNCPPGWFRGVGIKFREKCKKKI